MPESFEVSANIVFLLNGNLLVYCILFGEIALDLAQGRTSALGHVWTAPDWQELF